MLCVDDLALTQLHRVSVFDVEVPRGGVVDDLGTSATVEMVVDTKVRGCAIATRSRS